MCHAAQNGLLQNLEELHVDPSDEQPKLLETLLQHCPKLERITSMLVYLHAPAYWSVCV